MLPRIVFRHVQAKRLVFLLFLWAVFCSAAAAAAEPGRHDKLHVAVSILPQKYFLEQIGGDALDVMVMVPPGANPATYEPRPSQMKHLSKATIYFAAGVPFERVWLKRFGSVNPEMEIVSTWKGIERYPISAHGHGNDHENLDPHVWLSPPLAILLARNMTRALAERHPGLAARFVDNYRTFARKAVELDRSIMKLLGITEPGRRPRAFMVFHPSWGYFARAYGLVQIPIEQEGKEPKPSQLARLVARAKQLSVRVILVQPQFPARAARLVAQATGASLITADPLALDWDENLLAVARALGKAFHENDD